MRCCNEKCNNSPAEPNYILVTCDGDFVCNAVCKAEYEKQRDQFFNVTIQSDQAMNRFFNSTGV